MRCFTIAFAAAVLLGLTASSISVAQEATATTPTFQPGDVQTQASKVYVFVEKTGLGHQHGVEANLLTSSLVFGATENAG